MTEQALVIGTGVNKNVLYCVALTIVDALECVVDITDRRPRVAVNMILVAHVNISGHEEDDALGLAACINILLERLKVVKSVYAVCITLNAVRTRGKELTYACGRSVVAVVFFVRITILELTGCHEPWVVPGMVTFTDKRHGVAPAAVLTVILQKYPCVECIEKACGSNIVYLRCFFKRAVVVILLKAVRKGENIDLGTRRCAVISALSGILEVVAVFDGRLTKNIAGNTAGNAGLAACAECRTVRYAVFNGRVVLILIIFADGADIVLKGLELLIGGQAVHGLALAHDDASLSGVIQRLVNAPLGVCFGLIVDAHAVPIDTAAGGGLVVFREGGGRGLEVVHKLVKADIRAVNGHDRVAFF